MSLLTLRLLCTNQCCFSLSRKIDTTLSLIGSGFCSTTFLHKNLYTLMFLELLMLMKCASRSQQSNHVTQRFLVNEEKVIWRKCA